MRGAGRRRSLQHELVETSPLRRFDARAKLTVSLCVSLAVMSSLADVEDPATFVMFDLSNRGTLKLVSLLGKLDTREEWVQDTDRIEVTTR